MDIQVQEAKRTLNKIKPLKKIILRLTVIKT